MAFGVFEVHAGDFKKGKDHQFARNKLIMKVDGKFFREEIDASKIDVLEVASEENVKNLGGAMGWGAAGVLLLGPVGLLAGLVAGGAETHVTFICKFKDGRKFMASAPSKVYTQLLATKF